MRHFVRQSTFDQCDASVCTLFASINSFNAALARNTLYFFAGWKTTRRTFRSLSLYIFYRMANIFTIHCTNLSFSMQLWCLRCTAAQGTTSINTFFLSTSLDAHHITVGLDSTLSNVKKKAPSFRPTNRIGLISLFILHFEVNWIFLRLHKEDWLIRWQEFSVICELCWWVSG